MRFTVGEDYVSWAQQEGCNYTDTTKRATIHKINELVQVELEKKLRRLINIKGWYDGMDCRGTFYSEAWVKMIMDA